MSTGSTLPGVKRAFITALRARAGMVGVTVAYSEPTTFETDDNVWWGSASASTSLTTMRGGSPLVVEENYVAQLHIQAATFVDDGQEVADLRITALLSEVQQELATRPQITSDILIAELAGWEQMNGPSQHDGSGYAAEYVCRIRVRARVA